MMVHMGSREQTVIGLESRAVSARVTQHFVTIFSQTCNNNYDNDNNTAKSTFSSHLLK